MVHGAKVHIWPSCRSNRSRQIEALDVVFSIEESYLLIKQYPVLCESTDSYVCYKLPLSALCFLSSDAIGKDSRIICLQIRQQVIAQKHVDASKALSSIVEEEVTLEMCCTLSDTIIEAYSKIDIVIPDALQHDEAISTLSDALRNTVTTELSSARGSEDINNTAKTPPESLALNDEAVKWLSGKGIATVSALAPSMHAWSDPTPVEPLQNLRLRTAPRANTVIEPLPARGRPYPYKRGSRGPLPGRTQPLLYRTPEDIDDELENNAKKQEEFWGEALKMPAVRPVTNRKPATIQLSSSVGIEARSAWNRFAVGDDKWSQEPQPACIPKAYTTPWVVEAKVADQPGDTGGYLADHKRNHHRSDEDPACYSKPRHSPRKKVNSPRRHGHIQAEFMPRSNAMGNKHNKSSTVLRRNTIDIGRTDSMVGNSGGHW